MNNHPCKLCVNFTTETIESKNQFEIMVPLCGFSIYFEIVYTRCANYRENMRKP